MLLNSTVTSNRYVLIGDDAHKHTHTHKYIDHKNKIKGINSTKKIKEPKQISNIKTGKLDYLTNQFHREF